MSRFTTVMMAVATALTVMLLALSASGLMLQAMSLNGMFVTSLTGTSMQPYAYAGDLVIGDRSAEPREGDAIVFYTGSGRDSHLVFHRIVGETLAESGGWLTKGDNNSVNDGFVTRYDDVVAVEVAVLPHLGFLASVPASTCAVCLVLCVVLVLGLVLARWFETGRIVVAGRSREGAVL